MGPKTEIYTWRVSPAIKSRLEDTARVRGRSVAQLLDELVVEGLDRVGQDTEAEVDRQQRLHSRARRFLGCLSGGRSRRSERVRELVRTRLRKRHSRAR